MPIESVLLGVEGAKHSRLTAKQKAFALEVAKGETKAGAYRKAYKSKGKPATCARQGHDIAKLPHVSAIIEAERLALEAERYATPAALRALTIHQLKLHALNEDFPPAQRIKALELLGKVTEVALFTERREIIKSEDSSQARDKLMSMLRHAITANATDADIIDADSLLAELSPATSPGDYQSIQEPNEAQAIDADAAPSPPATDPPKSLQSAATPLHSIPHIQSLPISAGTPTSKGDPSEAEGVVILDSGDAQISV